MARRAASVMGIRSHLNPYLLNPYLSESSRQVMLPGGKSRWRSDLRRFRIWGGLSPFPALPR